jgi:hypothetical protein
MAGYDWQIHAVCNMHEEFPQYKHIGDYHTHGLDKYGHKELCLPMNFRPEAAVAVLNTIGERISEGAVYFEGLYEDQFPTSVEFVSFPDVDELFVILPDSNGRFPDDPDGCSEYYRDQYKHAELIAKVHKGIHKK